MPSIRSLLTAVLVLALCLLAACATPQDDLSVVSVTPSSVTIGEATRITVNVGGLQLQAVGGQARLAGIEIQACGVSLTELELGELDRQVVAVAPGGAQVVFTGGSLSGLLPTKAEAGISDVVVSTAHSGSGIAVHAIECVQPEPEKPDEPEPEEPDEPEEPATPSITIEPQETGLIAGQPYRFTATVHELDDQAVSWSLTGVGTIDDAAANPVTFRSNEAGSATLVATSVADPELSTSLDLNVTYPEFTVSISPDVTDVYPQQEQVFTATVAGWDDARVTWQVSPDPQGAIETDGNELAFTPAIADSDNDFTLTATSVANPAESASVTVKVVSYPITLSPTSITLAPGESVELTASSMDPGDFEYEWSASAGSLSGTTGSAVTFTAPVHFDAEAELSVSVTSPGNPTGTAVDIDFETRLEVREDSVLVLCPRQLVLVPAFSAWHMLGNHDDCGGDAVNVSWSVTGGASASTAFYEFTPDAHAVPQPDGSLFIAATTGFCPTDHFGFLRLDNTKGLTLGQCYGTSTAPYRIVDMRPMTDSRSLVLAAFGSGAGRTYDLMYVNHTTTSMSVVSTRSSNTASFVPAALWYSEGQTIVAGSVGNTTLLERFVPDVDGDLATLDTLQVHGPGSLTPTEVAMDASGDILLATIAVDEPGADGIMRLFKLDGESGETIWSKDLGSTGDWGVTGIAVAPDDTAYLAGQYLEPGQASELFVAAIGADGEQLWREQFTKPGSGITASTELLFWDDSTLMVGGYAGPGDDIDESFVLKLNLD